MKSLIIGLAVMVTASAVLTLHTATSNDETAQAQFHCDMVVMWNEDAAQGIEERRRRGWPNYNNQECK
jgi:hypothetical protein